MGNAHYVLGNSANETRRLMLQAQLLDPIMRRLLRAVRLTQGMRVLDLGCGAGDVSMMAAELTGPAGSVLGIDQNPESIEMACHRARQAGLAHVTFRVGSVDDLPDEGPFDALIGRCILHHLHDPTATLRRALEQVRPGGIVAFQELDASVPPRATPEVPVWTQATSWLRAIFQHPGAQYDAGARLVEIFTGAGLPFPEMFGEAVAGGGPGSPIYPWFAATMRNLVPRLVQSGIATEEEIGIETFEQRLEAQAVERRAQFVSSPQYCAWTRKS